MNQNSRLSDDRRVVNITRSGLLGNWFIKLKKDLMGSNKNVVQGFRELTNIVIANKIVQ